MSLARNESQKHREWRGSYQDVLFRVSRAKTRRIEGPDGNSGWLEQDGERCERYAQEYTGQHSYFQYCGTDLGKVVGADANVQVSARDACIKSCARCVRCAVGYGVARLDSLVPGSALLAQTVKVMLPFLGEMRNDDDGNADFDELCSQLFVTYQSAVDGAPSGNGVGSLCAKRFPVYGIAQHGDLPLTFATIRCTQATSKGTQNFTDLAALITVCTLPCEQDRSQKCCSVPRSIATMFSCCRSLGCCVDQQKSRRRRTQGAAGAAKLVVEASIGSLSRLNQMLDCVAHVHHGASEWSKCFEQPSARRLAPGSTQHVAEAAAPRRQLFSVASTVGTNPAQRCLYGAMSCAWSCAELGQSAAALCAALPPCQQQLLRPDELSLGLQYAAVRPPTLELRSRLIPCTGGDLGLGFTISGCYLQNVLTF